MRSLETLSGGEWVATGEWIEVHDPADVRTPLARVPALAAKDVTRAYDHAERGFAGWKRTSPFERARIFTGAAKLIRERGREIAADVTAENGKTGAEARGETLKAADFLDYYAGQARQGYGTLLHDARPDTRVHTQREPIGVILVISPWNDPLITPARKLAPLLATGNAAVFKPATETPLSGLHFARALHDAGLPAGVLNVVTGRTAEIEEALLEDPRIAAITFTGSNEVGNRIRRRLADRNVRFQGELGGKNASVVLKDADLPFAAKTVVAASFGQAGQRCTATSRVIVERPVHDEFTRLLVAEVEALAVGPGSDPATTPVPALQPQAARQRPRPSRGGRGAGRDRPHRRPREHRGRPRARLLRPADRPRRRHRRDGDLARGGLRPGPRRPRRGRCRPGRERGQRLSIRPRRSGVHP